MYKFRSVKHYSMFYQDDNLMDCDSTGGCDGGCCNHSDCSYYNFHLIMDNVQERYVNISDCTNSKLNYISVCGKCHLL